MYNIYEIFYLTALCKPEAANTVQSSWWWAVYHSKHVELSINGIINSITRLHLVGYFYWFNHKMCSLTEGEFHSIQNKSSQPHFMKDGACVSCGWPAQ